MNLGNYRQLLEVLFRVFGLKKKTLNFRKMDWRESGKLGWVIVIRSGSK